MNLNAKDVAALAILAQSPERRVQIVRGLRGAARQIGQAMISSGRSSGRYGEAANDIRTWAQTNRRLAKAVK